MATARSTVKKRSKSVLKRIRQNEKRRLRNQSWQSRIKTSLKKVEEAIEKKEKEQTQELLNEAVKIISKAASKGVIHKNTASRKISRLMKKVNLKKE
ncbi:30S ribosomal protein S20 [Thermodesulfovibrio sp.]|uniref:30S ribosomal protein S20 n=1 Tax=Thermodesulfovibrio TaxID=28261 RepID=UPI00260B0548|nr:30S ribosomal protein S20 [Thermodesulfovibrio sp.]